MNSKLYFLTWTIEVNIFLTRMVFTFFDVNVQWIAKNPQKLAYTLSPNSYGKLKKNSEGQLTCYLGWLCIRLGWILALSISLWNLESDVALLLRPPPSLSPVWDRLSLYSPGCPRIHCVDQDGLKLIGIHLLLPPVLGLKCMHCYIWLMEFIYKETIISS